MIKVGNRGWSGTRWGTTEFFTNPPHQRIDFVLVTTRSGKKDYHSLRIYWGVTDLAFTGEVNKECWTVVISLSGNTKLYSFFEENEFANKPLRS